MRSVLSGLLLVMLGAYALQVLAAQEDESSISIGVVDWRAALFQTKAAQVEDERMKNENVGLLSRAGELEQLVETKKRSLEKDQAIMSAEEITRIRDELGQHLREYEAITIRLQEVQAQAEAGFVVSQRENVDKALKLLAKKYDLDFVFERQAVVYGKKVRNLTGELTDEINKLQ